MLKFSIIIPTYNRANLLLNAIKSILSQTYRDFELIIVNDGSIDDTEKVVGSFDDDRIVYIKHRINRGVYAGENTGVQTSKGEFIMFLGDDDELYPNALSLVFSKTEDCSLKKNKILWFDSIDLDTKTCASHKDKKERHVSYKDLLCDTFKIDPILIIDGDLLRKKTIAENFWGDSGNIWLDFYKNDSLCLPLYIPQIICKSRSMRGVHMSHTETAMSNISKVITTQKFFLNKYKKELINICPERCGQRQAMLGLYQILNEEKREGRVSILESFKFRFSLKYFFLFLCSYILSGRQVKFFYRIFSKIKKFSVF